VLAACARCSAASAFLANLESCYAARGLAAKSAIPLQRCHSKSDAQMLKRSSAQGASRRPALVIRRKALSIFGIITVMVGACSVELVPASAFSLSGQERENQSWQRCMGNSKVVAPRNACCAQGVVEERKSSPRLRDEVSSSAASCLGRKLKRITFSTGERQGCLAIYSAAEAS